MTILYFYQYFCSPKGSWGTRVYEFARRWAKKGDKVIVVTSIYDKSDLSATGISSRLNIAGFDKQVINNPFIQKLSYKFERMCYKAAHTIVTLSPGMKANIENRFHLKNVESVPNASDNELFTTDTSGFQLPEWAAEKKIFLYTGNIG